MSTLKELKIRRKSIVSTKKVTSAMKMIAAGKLKNSQYNMQKANFFAHSMQNVAKLMIYNEERLHEKYFKVKGNRTVFVLVTADRGMCGGFSNNAIKKFRALFNYAGGDMVIGIGNKACDFLKKNPDGVIAIYPDFYKDLDFNKVIKVIEQIMEQIRSNKTDRVAYIYNRFITALTQEVTSDFVLPLEIDPEIMLQKKLEMKAEVIFEPSPLKAFDFVFPEYLKGMLWKAVEESHAAENAARMVSMDSATDNASEMIDLLTLEINKARQAGITQEITEIVAGSANSG